MGVPTNVNSYDPAIAIDQGIFEISTTKKAPLGTRLRVGERTFHYALSATTATRAHMMIGPSLVASHFTGAGTALASAATGASIVTLTAGAAVTANQYADGYVLAGSTGLAGGGWLMKIKSHPAIGSGASGSITLYDSIPSTLAGQQASLIPNEFAGVTLGSATTQYPVGVAPIDVTSGSYFWLQTFGPAAVEKTAAVVPTLPVCMGSAGALVAYVALGASSAAAPIVGYAVHTGVATEAGIVQLTLKP